MREALTKGRAEGLPEHAVELLPRALMLREVCGQIARAAAELSEMAMAAPIGDGLDRQFDLLRKYVASRDDIRREMTEREIEQYKRQQATGNGEQGT